MFKIKGLIERRLLINFRLEAGAAHRYLPAPFEPKLVAGHAVVGICLIRLSGIRPGFAPRQMGLRSENAAHRFAVEWNGNEGRKQGVYIPRRDTSLWLNTVVGGRIFPGVHHRASFRVEERDPEYKVAFESADGTSLAVEGRASNAFPADSIFGSLEDSSRFFKGGSLGYSPGFKGEFQGLELITDQWSVRPFAVSKVESSFFANEEIFPKGSVKLDHALLMTNLEHSWRSGETLRR